MQLLQKLPQTQDHLAQANALAAQFARTAVERDKAGGTPKAERDWIRASGLLKLIIPPEYGGIGESWITAMQINRKFAEVDSSLAHLFSYHHLGVVAPHIFGSEEQKQRYYTLTAEHNWFWCNGFNPLDRRVMLTADGNRFRLNGTKSFCSGSADSDLIPVTAVQEDVAGFRIVIVPTQRQGVIVNGDWDNIGQRQTDSGSVTFDNVVIDPEEILIPSAAEVFKTFRSCLTQITFTNIYLGITIGALKAAKNYTQTQTRAWITSGVEKATADPYLLHHYGEAWTNLEAAILLTDRANQLVQAAWEKGNELTAEERGECAVAIATAKAFVTRIGLNITSSMFDWMGARATASEYGFDRFWRNLRTFTLHDPVDYKIRALGNWVLNGEFPTPDFYS
ncbi:monooxygenase [Leptolyngbya sp. NK1-12]|uniref:Dibenzothiophene monooxygenase n=1 Tax=Leptolyngbya sp. NK1-12 TaxID=2547451 RepID=A0AA96WK46_9CYAN|nr:monooxygenase [Leptolyngbya sp. NK1-12]